MLNETLKIKNNSNLEKQGANCQNPIEISHTISKGLCDSIALTSSTCFSFGRTKTFSLSLESYLPEKNFPPRQRDTVLENVLFDGTHLIPPHLVPQGS